MTWTWAYVTGPVPDWLAADAYVDRNGCERAEGHHENVITSVTECGDPGVLCSTITEMENKGHFLCVLAQMCSLVTLGGIKLELKLI